MSKNSQNWFILIQFQKTERMFLFEIVVEIELGFVFRYGSLFSTVKNRSATSEFLKKTRIAISGARFAKNKAEQFSSFSCGESATACIKAKKIRVPHLKNVQAEKYVAASAKCNFIFKNEIAFWKLRKQGEVDARLSFCVA